MRSSLVGASFVVVVAVACGSGCGSSGPQQPSGTSASALQGDTPGSCPQAPPSQGSDCPEAGLACSWGSDPRFGCRTQATCEGEGQALVWQVSTASCPSPPPTCPTATVASASGANECSLLGITCVYGDVAATCTPCSGTLCFPNNSWSYTSLAAGCPEAVPNLGAECGTPRLFCNYNVCADDQNPPDAWAYGIAVRCDGTHWKFDSGNMACL